ncbi:MAG: DUF1329 domain-containing protein [Halieaceae bacterium]|jgi:hypothetical protein|nr:DUF1329 domain-containing protein [Halieaceae bacterium]
MRIRRYDSGFSRRHFLSQLGRGVLATGVLAPLWSSIARSGSIEAAYPDELLSIEAYTNGKLGTGDRIDAGNVELVKDLLDPIQYTQVSQMGRVLTLRPTTTNIMELSPWEYVEATLRNQGQAVFAADGNVVTREGKPWIGGNPFPDPKSALEVFAGITLSWGRHDVSLAAVKEWDLDEQGQVAYQYQSCWVEMSPVGRLVLDPKPYLPGHEDKLRYQSVFFVSPNDIKGTSYLNIWHYDQNRYPDLYGYLPAFKRVRRFPTNQRFEPLIPGSTLYLSDAWAAGDPFLTWGNYRTVHRGPALAAVSNSWNSEHPNWEHSVHGGQAGQTFWDTQVELVPEAIVVEAEPTGYPRAPISKKRVWFDARTLLPLSMVSFDRRGEIFRSFDGAYSLYERGDNRVMDGDHPYWSWTRVHAHDIQTNRITRLAQVKEIEGGYRSQVNDPDVYDRYLTEAALRRLGT